MGDPHPFNLIRVWLRQLSVCNYELKVGEVKLLCFCKKTDTFFVFHKIYCILEACIQMQAYLR